MRLFISLLLCLSLALQPVTCGAEMYQMTEEELTRLEENLDELLSLTEAQELSLTEQEKLLKESEEMLAAAETKSRQLTVQLEILKKIMAEQESSLENARTSFERSIAEERQKQKNIKRQGNIACGLIGVLVCILAGK